MLIGIIGKTNTGKSTFLKAATLAEVEIGNRPFVTLQPNHAIGYVKIPCVDQQFNLKCQPKHGYCIKNQRFVPVELLDVAGLIEGAHQGHGLGNKFLDDLRHADAFIHIIDISGGTNAVGEPIEPLTYDPINDIKLIEKEIDLWFFQLLKKDWTDMIKKIKLERKQLIKEIAKRFSGLKITEEHIEKALKQTKLETEEDLLNFATVLREISKPMIIAANKIDVPGAEKNYQKIKEQFPELIIIPCSSESELALKEAAHHELIDYTPGEKNFEIKGSPNENQKQALEFIKTNILQKFELGTGVQDILNKIIFETLNQIAVFPVANSHLQDKDGNVLPDCFLVDQGTTALELAFKIHTDIGNKFIKAIDLKTKKIIGKDHPLNNLDVIEIMTR